MSSPPKAFPELVRKGREAVKASLEPSNRDIYIYPFSLPSRALGLKLVFTPSHPRARIVWELIRSVKANFLREGEALTLMLRLG